MQVFAHVQVVCQLLQIIAVFLASAAYHAGMCIAQYDVHNIRVFGNNSGQRFYHRFNAFVAA